MGTIRFSNRPGCGHGFARKALEAGIPTMLWALVDLNGYQSPRLTNAQLLSVADINGHSFANNVDIQAHFAGCEQGVWLRGSMIAVPKPASEALVLVGMLASVSIFQRCQLVCDSDWQRVVAGLPLQNAPWQFLGKFLDNAGLLVDRRLDQDCGCKAQRADRERASPGRPPSYRNRKSR
jgi:hypothetical protein